MITCEICRKSFTRMQSLERHSESKMHISRNIAGVKKYICGCGKYYLHQQSLRNHKRKCTCTESTVNTVDQLIIELKQDIDIQKLEFQKEREVQRQAFEKERQEMKNAFEESMKEQMNKILEKHAGNTTHNIETQNCITFNINAFGNENIDYIDDKAILACIGRVYKSIPSLLEKIYFDPEHPENHNIKITNKKLPYASVMGVNQKWKTVDRKDAIETMVLNGYNLLDEKYTENKDKMPATKQQHFEGFQSKFESDDKEVMRQIKSEVDMMVLNGGH